MARPCEKSEKLLDAFHDKIITWKNEYFIILNIQNFGIFFFFLHNIHIYDLLLILNLLYKYLTVIIYS